MPDANPPVSTTPSQPPSVGLMGAQGIPLWKRFLPHTFLLLLCFALYGNTLWNDFACDDRVVITENEFTKRGLDGIADIFSTDAFVGFLGEQVDFVAGGRYRPLSIATFAVERHFFGTVRNPFPNPAVSHLINLLIYALSGMFMLAFLRQLFPEKDPLRWWLGTPFLITLLYLVHPIHTEVVANLKGRDELMALLFLMGAMYAVFRYLDRQSLVWLAVGAGSFFLALLSKESPLPFVVILPLAIRMFRPQTKLEEGLTATGAFVLATVIYFAMRINFVGMGSGSENAATVLNDPFYGTSFAIRSATIAESMLIYFRQLIFPLRLSHDYGYNQVPLTHWADPSAFLPGLACVALLVGGIALSLRRKPLGFGILLFFLSFSIVSNVTISIGTSLGERFVFIPSLGFAMVVVLALQWVKERYSNLSTAFPLLAIVVISFPFSVRTFTRNYAWKNNFALYSTDGEIATNSTTAQTHAGGVLVEAAATETDSLKRKDLLARAVVHLERAVKIYPPDCEAHLVLGKAHFEQGNYEEAIKSDERGWTYCPDLWACYSNAAVAARKIPRYDLAASAYRFLAARQQIAFSEVDPGLWFAIAGNFADWGRVDSAVFYYEKTVDANPKFIEPWEKLGEVRAQTGDHAGAIAALTRGIAANPQAASLYLGLVRSYQALGDTGNAEIQWKQAYALDPSLTRP
jgi:protein O-mannosyl-transferase